MGAHADTLEQALAGVSEGCVLATGGATLSRKPMAAVRHLARSGLSGLQLVTFAGSLEVEELVRAGALASVRSSYVGLGPHGRAPAFCEAVQQGRIEDLEESEWMLLGGLRAAAAGLAFMPTRAALGSALLEGRGIRTVRDPYTDAELLAMPPLRPDVCLLHAWRADREGNVQFPALREHLWDVDLLLARASKSVVVTVEHLIETDELAERPELTVLHGFEVDWVVAVAGGAAPTACEPDYEADAAAIAAEARRTG